MSNVIRIKRRVSGAAGAPGSLKSAELAYNMADDTIYAGYGDDGSGNATSVKPVGGEGTFAKLASPAFTGTPTAPTASTSDNSTQLATTAFVKAQGYLTANQSITVSGDASGSGTTAISLTLASVGTAGTYTKVTTDAKGRVTSGTTLAASDIPTLTAAKISDFDTQVRTSRLDQMAAPTASVGFNSQKITSLADPTNAQDAATKAYVDAVAQGIDAKQSVLAATTANITLSGAQTIDGVSVVAGDRVLVKNQSTASQNGIYVAASGAWTRATDMDAWAEVPNAFVFVEQGSTQADTSWVCSTNAGGTLDTTAIDWFQFGSAAAYTAGNGLQLTGNAFSVLADGSSLSVSGSGVKISASYAGQSSITTLGTIATGVWQGTAIGVAYGGTGATSLTGLIKGNGTSAFTAAVAGTDYHDMNSTIDGGTF